MKQAWTFKTTVPTVMDGQPLRQLLHEHWLIPKHLIFSLRTANRVLINGHYQPVNFPVQAGAEVQLVFTAADFNNPYPEVRADTAATVEINYEDENLLVVNKRRGNKTHPNQPGEVGATINHVAAYLKAQNTVPYMIHRLDQETSGALIFAKNPAVVPVLVAKIAKKAVRRTYLAWVMGTNLPSRGTINLAIGLDPEDKRKRKVNGPLASTAITHYRVLREEAGYSLLAIQLETGRTHQIRVHLAAIGHPLVGDPLYNPNDPNNALLLHSWQVQLTRPFSEQELHVTSPIPPHFNHFERQLI